RHSAVPFPRNFQHESGKLHDGVGDPKTLAAASVSLERRDGTLTTSVKRLVSASLSSWARNGMGLELAKIADPTVTLPSTISGATTFGGMCRSMMRISFAPIT